MAEQKFKNTLRLRVCGILVEEANVLLVRLKSPVTGKMIWMPPGGGLEFGESMEACLQRELKEETGLKVSQNSLVFVNEMIHPPHHAVESYFWVDRIGGNLQLGNDPSFLIRISF